MPHQTGTIDEQWKTFYEQCKNTVWVLVLLDIYIYIYIYKHECAKFGFVNLCTVATMPLGTIATVQNFKKKEKKKSASRKFHCIWTVKTTKWTVENHCSGLYPGWVFW